MLWRGELNGEFEQARSYLRRLPGITDRIRDPDHSRQWMTVHPTENEEIYVAESEDFPAHRNSFEIAASEVALWAPDWDVIRPALAAALGFTASASSVQHSPTIRQLGFSQPEIGNTIPVFLYIPGGGFSDPRIFLAALHHLPESVLFVPTNRHLVPEVFAVSNARKIAIESIADRLLQSAPAATTLNVAGMVIMDRLKLKNKKRPHAILAVQPCWIWEKLTIKLTEKGTLVAKYGTARGEYRFGRKEGPGGEPKYPIPFKILFRTCIIGHWENPPRTDRSYGATQKNFSRLSNLLKTLIRIDGNPFRKINGGWEPKFQFEPDPEFRAMLDFQTENRSNTEKISYRDFESFEDDPEDEDF